MQIFAAPSAASLNIGLAILRVITGGVFVAHGAQKLFVWGPAAVAAGFESTGIPLAGIAGPLVGFAEFFGGIALVAGLLTRPVAAALGVIMLGAIWYAHLPAGFFLPNGYEFVLTLFGGSALFALAGGGAWSVDAVIARRRGEPMSVASLRAERSAQAA
jgi:putative oxidoreductase